MYMLLIDTAILVFLVKLATDEDVGLGAACGLAFGAAVASLAIGIGLVSLMGVFGLVLAAVIVAAGVGFCVAAFWGVDVKRAMIVGGAYVVLDVGAHFALRAMTST